MVSIPDPLKNERDFGSPTLPFAINKVYCAQPNKQNRTKSNKQKEPQTKTFGMIPGSFPKHSQAFVWSIYTQGSMVESQRPGILREVDHLAW